MNNRELQEIQKLIDSDSSHDNHYLVSNNKVRHLLSTIEAQSKELEQLRKELKGIGVEEYYTLQRRCWDLNADNEQLRNQLKEAEQVIIKIRDRYASEYGRHIGIAEMREIAYKYSLSHIQGKEVKE